jgi:UPF0716 family protein affecting phage T7 exclusion
MRLLGFILAGIGAVLYFDGRACLLLPGGITFLVGGCIFLPNHKGESR